MDRKKSKTKKIILIKLLKEIKEGYYLPYFSERAEERAESEGGIDAVEDVRNDLEKIVIDFIECRIIEAEDEIDDN
jgi:hypothetical protein